MNQHSLIGRELARAVRGAVEVRDSADGCTPHRLPLSTRSRQADDGIEHMAAMAAGVRVPLATTASLLVVDLTARLPVPHAHRETPGRLVVEVDGEVRERIDLAAGRQRARIRLGPTASARTVTLWLSQTATVTLHSITADSALRPEPSSRARWRRC